MAEPYMPETSDELINFEARWCDRCRYQHRLYADDDLREDAPEPCAIWQDAYLFQRQPWQWIETPTGPTCKAFEERTNDV